MNKRFVVILDNVRSAHNVGSIFRTADGAGIEKIYLLGYTPAPIDRFGRKQPEIAKTSLGAAQEIPWEHIENENRADLVKRLKVEGFSIVAVEQDKTSVKLADFSLSGPVCFILGNEVEGVNKELLNLADQIVEIPMNGTKESLNVSVAAGVVLFWAKEQSN